MKSLIVAFLCLVTTVLAVFSDEAYITDWKIRQIGPVDSSNILYPRGEILNLLTKTKTLAGIQKGDVRWRVAFTDLLEDSTQKLIPIGDNVATALNYNNRSIIQIWDPINGFLIEDFAIFPNKEIKNLQSTSHGDIIVVFVNGDVSFISSNGDVKELSPISKSEEVKISPLDNGKFIILFREIDTENTHYAFYDGEELKSHTLQISWSSIREFYGTKLVYETIKHYTLIFNKNTGVVSKPNPINQGKFEHFLPIDNDELVAFEKNHNIEVVSLDGSPKFQIPNVHRYKLTFQNGVFVIYTEYHANIIDPELGFEIKSYFLGDSKTPFDQINSILTTTDGVSNIHTLFEFSNSTYSYAHNGATIWTRDASLSEVLAHAVVDFELETSLTTDELLHEEQLELVDAYLFRVKKHYKELKALYNAAWEYLPTYITTDFWNNDKPSENYEYFGFVKLLVLGSKTGRVTAVNTLNGERVWTYDTEQVDDILSISNIDNQKLFIFTKSGPRIELNAKTGEFIEKKLIAAPVHIEKLYNETFYVEIENEFNIVVSDQSQEDVANKTNYIVKHDSKKVQGVKIEGKRVHTTWKFEANIDEEIVAFASKDVNEKIANVGLVLGDRSVLYKYLYPNLAAFAVLNKPSKTLYIHIVDTITGELIHSTYHDEEVHQEESFNVIFGEHWVIYSYWSNKPYPEQKIVVIDLFESLKPNERFSNGNSTSSFDYRQPPAISTKSFILPFKINSMAISQTKFGVTTKAIVISLENGQILYLPKYILSSRRIEGRELTNDEKSEFMQSPYDPIITVNDQYVISHHREVLGASTLLSIPTNLESTSIICSYGLDVFCTRISPSSQFDKLTSSFDKVKLVGSILLLILVLLILKPLKDSRNLKALWVIES